MTEGDRPAALDALVAVAVRLAAAEQLAPATAEPALRAIADAGVAALQVAAASIALHDPATNRLVFRAAAGPQGESVIGVAIAPHEGIAGYVFSTGQPLAVADVATDPRFERGTAERTGYVPRSLLAVPLVDAEGIVGVMEWLDRIDGAPIDAEAVVTALTADLAAGDALWRLADRIGRLRDADPDDLDLAVAWLDALLARTHRRGRAARRPA